MKNTAFITVILLSLLCSSCIDYLEPNPYNGTYSEEYVWSTPSFAEGVLMEAFNDVHPASWRVQSNDLMAVMTDDAVSSFTGSVAGNFAQGLQSPYYNLSYLDTWDSDYENIFNLNKFLENMDGVTYDPDSLTNQRFIQKYTGDAYFLRAWFHWSLLKRYGGLVGEQVMGVPVVKKPLELEEAYALERPTYMETVKSIVQDCDSALKYVPTEYKGNEDPVMGISYYGSPTQAIVRSFIGIVYTFAASPAYNISNDLALWDSAAARLSEALILIDGELNSNALPIRNFHDPEDPDVIWRSAYQQNYGNEIANYPPSLRGSGRTNPGQNLVEEFGDVNGYPISESSVYDPDKPYLNRDNRFSQTFVYNGSEIGRDTSIIEVHSTGADSRANYKETGTRTGYYLRKLLSQNVTLFPEQRGIEPTFFVTISKTDLYLLFAEAMNELAGPLDSRYGISARNTLLKIRKRAGIESDLYLQATAAQGQDKLRELIRRERRVELCFEGKRYWDLRRWGDLDMLNVPVTGVEIEMINDTTFTYIEKIVEQREYSNIYAPLPYDEVIKMDNLDQNAGW